MIVDLRSDTVTKPGRGMLDAMMAAKVGDDVFGEDTTVNQLEKKAAELFGMEAALFCPSGTMSNQVAIKAHTQPGDEVICEETSHIYQYEGGGIAFNAGCQVKLLQGNRGRVTASQVEAAINPDDVHKPVSRLVGLENSCNRGGGSCYDPGEIQRIRETCNRLDLLLHLDGARLFNALVARKENPDQYGKLFHSISICLNKGLGCPVGSILMGTAPFIRKARRIRKVFGGGMRQAGYMAACGLYAFENNIKRLEEDHRHAALLGEALANKNFVHSVLPVETNIVIFETKPGEDSAKWVQKFEENGIRTIRMAATQIRLVTHLDISPAMIDYTLSVIQRL